MARKNGSQQTKMTYVVGFLALFVMPAFVTAIAPVSYVTLKHEAGRVSARARICLFFVIPYLERELGSVTRVDGDWLADRDERDSRGNEVHIEGEAFLVLHGPDGRIAVPVSPVNVDRVISEAHQFVTRPDGPTRSFITVANWKFSVLLGVPLTLLAGTWLAGFLLALWHLLRGRRPAPAPPAGE